jgi:Tfp pilus assembly protein PilZ
MSAMSQQQPPESTGKRKHRRVPFAFDVKVEGAHRRLGACQRIATAGLHLFTPHVLPAGEEVNLSFTLPDAALTRVVTSGRVLRSQREDTTAGTLGGMMVLFTGLDPHDEDALRTFVLRCIKREQEYGRAKSLSATRQRLYSARFFGTGEVNESYVVDISEGGLYVRTLDIAEPGEPVLVDLYVPGAGEVTRVTGNVVWRRPHDPNSPGGAGVGIQFDTLPDHAADLVREFMEIFGQD